MTTREARRILQLPQGAREKDIKRAFRAASMVYHPDKGGDEYMFRRILAAKEHLLRSLKRRAASSNEYYDAYSVTDCKFYEDYSRKADRRKQENEPFILFDSDDADHWSVLITIIGCILMFWYFL